MDNTHEALSKAADALIALTVASNPYTILFLYEDIQEKVNALFRAKWESLDDTKVR
jgi:hypothetical protein